MPARAADIVCSISLRTDAAGGEVRADIAPDELSALRSALNGGTGRGLIILLHGYNNNYKEADEAYAGFFDRQYELGQPPEGRSIAENRVFLKVYWPGDAAWGIASALYYMQAIKRAKESARLIGAMLATLAGRSEPLEVEIVGHSLGCRLLFEAMRPIVGERNLILKRVVLMAAAVPTFMMESTQQADSLRHVYDVALKRGGQARSLYSPSDAVLSGAFPAGQSLAAGNEGIAPTAIGHDYWICGRMPERFGQYEVIGAGHSDYWGWNTKARPRKIGLDAQKQVREFLQLTVAAPRQTAERGALEGDTAESRSTPSRQVAASRTTTADG